VKSLDSRILVIGHRGSSGSAPENTMAAFHRAAAMGADMIELDVRLTRDGRLAVFHDRRLARTTNGKGSLRKHTAQELRLLDAGRWFGPRFAGEQIPFLEDVLHSLPPGLGLNIEVKTDGDTRWSAMMVPALMQTLRRHGSGRNLLVTSFNHRFLRRLHESWPGISIGALAMPVRDAGISPSVFGRRLGARVYVCSRSRLRKHQVLNAHNNGLQVYVYGVNTARQLKRPQRYGVDGVITDYPDRLLRMLSQTATLHTQPRPS